MSDLESDLVLPRADLYFAQRQKARRQQRLSSRLASDLGSGDGAIDGCLQLSLPHLNEGFAIEGLYLGCRRLVAGGKLNHRGSILRGVVQLSESDVGLRAEVKQVHLYCRRQSGAVRPGGDPAHDLEAVLHVRDEDELEEALEQHDPEIFLLAASGDDDDDDPLASVLELLPDVPAGKLAAVT